MTVNQINGQLIFTKPANWDKQRLLDYEHCVLVADEIDDTVTHDFGGGAVEAVQILKPDYQISEPWLKQLMDAP